MYIYIKATRIEKIHGEIFCAEIPDGPPLTKQQMEVLDQLFPNLKDQAEKLLEKEQFFALMPTDTEVRLAEIAVEAETPAGESIKSAPVHVQQGPKKM